MGSARRPSGWPGRRMLWAWAAERGEAFGGVGAGLAVWVVGPGGVGVEDFVERDAVTDVELLAEHGSAVAPLVGW